MHRHFRADIANGVLFFQGMNDSEVIGTNIIYGLEEAQSTKPDTAWGVITRAFQVFYRIFIIQT